ncbi:MAG TPA: DUF4350 domain-containing protein [Candidatus Obscuribacterales bacterium]
MKDTARQETTHRIWWQLATLLVVSALCVYAGIAFDEQKDKFWPEAEIMVSTFNRKPSGLSALKEIAQKAGFKVNTWQLPYRQLPGNYGMLVIIRPSESLSDVDAEQILKWVFKGNDLIYFDDFAFKLTRKLIEKLGIEAKDGEPVVDEPVRVEVGIREFAHVKTISVSSDRRLSGGTALLKDKSGSLIVFVKHGKGRIFLGSIPTICSNRRLAQQKNWPNFQFFINCFATAHGDILFDERCHGFSSATNVYHFLLRGPSGLVFMQLVAMLALGVFSSAHRFGKAKRVEVKRKISNLEFIFGLSNAYRRARANTAVLEIIGQSFKNKLAKTLGISPHEPDNALVEAWKSSPYGLDNTLEAFFGEYESALSSKHLSDHDLKMLVGTCDKIASNLRDSEPLATVQKTGVNS